MREKKHFSMTALISCFGLVVLAMGLAGCSTDRTPATNANGVSAPVDAPQGDIFTDPFLPACTIPQSLVLGGVNPQTGEHDPALEAVVILKNEFDDPLSNRQVKLRWTNTYYPNRVVCSTPSGVSYSYSNGTHTLTATTDGNGVARFRVAGGFEGELYDCNANPTARYGSVLVGSQTLVYDAFVVSAVDLNNTSAINAADWSGFNHGFYCSGDPYLNRIDFNGDLYINSADLSFYMGIDNGGGSDAHGCE